MGLPIVGVSAINILLRPLAILVYKKTHKMSSHEILLTMHNYCSKGNYLYLRSVFSITNFTFSSVSSTILILG